MQEIQVEITICTVFPGIDGFSRLIVYLHCSNNNLASTVMAHFRQAVELYGVPSRVCSDHGLVEIARFMITTRGLNRGSIITGSSVHNQRVEHMWKDVRRVVVRQYQNLFHYMESVGCLNPLDDVHLFALHHVYMPRINRALEEFIIIIDCVQNTTSLHNNYFTSHIEQLTQCQ